MAGKRRPETRALLQESTSGSVQGGSVQATVSAAMVGESPQPLPEGMINTHGSHSLRVHIDGLQTEITAARQRISILASLEGSAVERHDKAALDSAWIEHDACIERIRRLEGRQEQIARDLVRQAELEIKRWRSNTELQVQRWRDEQIDTIQRMLDEVRRVGATLDSLESGARKREQERVQLLEQFEAIRNGLPGEFPQPDIDWRIPSPDLREIAARLSELSERCVHTMSRP